MILKCFTLFKMFGRTLQQKKNNGMKDLINTIARGDTKIIESFFNKPGGRKYLENITLILINTLPNNACQKEELYAGFIGVLDKIEERIQHQIKGQLILEKVFGK